MKQKIQTFADVLAITGKTMEDAPKVIAGDGLSAFLHATWKAALIAQAYNNNEIPDATNHDKWRHYPWVIVEKDSEAASGFRFSASAFVFGDTCTGVGPRLCFHNSADVLDATEKFKDVYIELFTK